MLVDKLDRIRSEYLYGHLTGLTEILREVDRGGAAPPKLALETVSGAERGREPRVDFRQGRRSAVFSQPLVRSSSRGSTGSAPGTFPAAP
jgi:hypothetical protein